MPEAIEVKFRIDPSGFHDMEELQHEMGTKNLATALYSAVQMLKQLYDYQRSGYSLALIKNGSTESFKLPEKKAAA